ncbi:DUF4982 domain-containing protein [Saccharicrinis fermentans]|uniref:CBM6 domain-containing protein n=1 Tax=Saccharicrinis fermentans DSM 9555 = JCM 21142 TaxID=869213 RepID=W7YGB4_9BACT|nr:DUF4982 domain-containing protein [Saccharicrinis fermentans]GAF01634.1 hypothetical protein JCM21142_246 [Saccharicrinis fermentans DSM 9555 = JCM 21142]
MVYSNCDEVELFVNGRSLGKDKPGTKWDEMQCEWMVPYEEGTILAKGYVNGRVVSSTAYTTAGRPASIQLMNDSTIDISKDNIAIVTTSITDSSGVFYPYGENCIYYHIDGDAQILSLENGDPVDTTKNVNVNYRRAFMGLTRAFLKVGKEATNVGLTAAAIVGEKQGLTSNKVCIDVKSMTILGQWQAQPTQIYYTLDGSLPTVKSNLYKGAFPVEMGTIVRAIVVQNREVILEMQEEFDVNTGLCWDDATLHPQVNESEGGMRAIDADFSGATVQTKNGVKYLDFNGQEGHVVWYQENDGSAGSFTLKINYASKDQKSLRPMDLIINSKKVARLKFTSTDSWNAGWKQIVTSQKLEAGANYIELRSVGQSAPNILMLQVE